MRPTILLSLALLPLAAPATHAQEPRREQRRVFVAPRMPAMDALMMARDAEPHAVLGITTGGSGVRDTLGLLVTTVVPNSPAEKAGIDEGNRLVAINGVNLRADAQDAGDEETASLLSRRLVRTLEKVKPGDEVQLRVYADGRTRDVRVKTANSDSLYAQREGGQRFMRDFVERARDRATLGVGIGATGSKRDTLGVFVMSVVDSGPAARAGLIEGDRIAAVNGVDLRVSREDAGDPVAAQSKARKLERTISALTPGSDVELRVWSDGRYRTIRAKVVKASELPRGRNAIFFMGPGGMDVPMPPMPRMAPMPPVPPMPPMMREMFEGTRAF